MPDLKSSRNELAMLEKGYSQYLGLAQSWRMANPDFLTQFRRMLLSKVRAVFESAASEVEQWSKAATAQVELQLRERRRAFSRRREALQRVQQASGELEQRIAEVQSNDEHLAELQARLDAMSEEALANARRPLPELRSPAALSATAQDAA
jgi:exonuclease VII large subunit